MIWVSTRFVNCFEKSKNLTGIHGLLYNVIVP